MPPLLIFVSEGHPRGSVPSEKEKEGVAADSESRDSARQKSRLRRGVSSFRPFPDAKTTMKNLDLHGQVPDQSSTALLIIDVINDLEFAGGEALLRHAVPMAQRIATLKRQMKRAGIPAIYANDNFGRWRSDFHKLVRQVRDNDCCGRPLVDLLAPEEDDYCVLKPKHSGFFHTTLDLLLRYLQVTTLIITGIQTHICVLFTANDAYIRDLELMIPSDCVAAEQREDHEYALRLMRQVLKADIRPSTDFSVDILTPAGRPPSAAVPNR